MLDLAPHDTALDAAPRGFCCYSEARNRGDLWVVAIEKRGQEQTGRVLMKRQHAPLLVLTSKDYSTETFLSLKTDAYGLRMALADCLAKNKWGRSLFLGAGGQLRQPGEFAQYEVLLSPHGWGVWRLLNWTTAVLSRQQIEFSFPAREPDEFARTEAGDIVSWLWTESEETSDFAFARRFLELSPNEQEAYVWAWKRGDGEQLKNILRIALLAQDELWTKPRSLTWYVDLSNDMKISWHGEELYEGDDHIPTPVSLKDALESLLTRFELQIHYETHQRYLCVSRLYDQMRSRLRFSIQVQQPTAHERLEAMMEWRAWLENTPNAT